MVLSQTLKPYLRVLEDYYVSELPTCDSNQNRMHFNVQSKQRESQMEKGKKQQKKPKNISAVHTIPVNSHVQFVFLSLSAHQL